MNGTGKSLKDGLKATLQKLAKAQGEGDFTVQTAPGHLLAAMSGLLTDQLEQPDGVARIQGHGPWLHEDPAGPIGPGFVSQMNSVLLTAGPTGTATPYVPGTVFRIPDANQFATTFGTQLASLIDLCCKNPNRVADWRAAVKPVLIELSPVCDAANDKRVSALLTGGVVIPVGLKSLAHDKDAFGIVSGTFRMRWPTADFQEQDVILAFCHRYRMTMPAGALPAWLEPWFRLRELPTASIRNLGAAYAARVGYVSLF